MDTQNIIKTALRGGLAALAMAVVSAMPAQAASADYYLKIEGIKGEATATAGPDHTDWIPIQNYKVEDAADGARIKRLIVNQRLDLDSGAAQDGTAASGQQRSRGDTTLGDVVVVRELDKSSTKLKESSGNNPPRASSTKLMAETAHGSNAGSGKNVASMDLARFADSGNSAGRLIIAERIGDRMVAREVFEGVSGDADDRPTEEVAFYYNKIAFSYAKTKDGKKGGNVEYEWKVEEGEK